MPNIIILVLQTNKLRFRNLKPHAILKFQGIGGKMLPTVLLPSVSFFFLSPFSVLTEQNTHHLWWQCSQLKEVTMDLKIML